ncbi:UDP-N-acetylmuramyl pentapeptide phosphotransferase [Microbacterium rhizomatis]|uniref:UDP-N-acetylmuramyl pentapeptide phosphotransferase n=1 Tax=Microbacterium rhizomatis TaxID=1631477 RepID=A0A5J5J226_9MICO|nr:UDP-N-acetylmuramyl pentapeptide phosphotransferase [Microbacterium rhizomatis]KAA9110146.1 UDP-N-acetylmuramyl pentapeptide phosphotransferase [Microbacterium rhizomatis]
MSAAAPTSNSAPQTGAQAVIADAVDPARRPDVLFRVRRDEGHQPSAWWMIGAFVGVSAAVIALLSFVPGGA